MFVGQSELLPVTVLEQRAPHVGREHQSALGPPVIGEVNSMKAVPSRHFDQPALEIHDQGHDRTEPVGFRGEVQHGVFETSQQRIDCEAAQIEACQSIAVAGLLCERGRGGHPFLFAQRRDAHFLHRRQCFPVRHRRMSHRPVVE